MLGPQCCKNTRFAYSCRFPVLRTHLLATVVNAQMDRLGQIQTPVMERAMNTSFYGVPPHQCIPLRGPGKEETPPRTFSLQSSCLG